MMSPPEIQNRIEGRETKDERVNADQRHERRTRPTLHQHHPRTLHRRRAARRVRPPRPAAGLRADGLPSLDALHAPQPEEPEVAGARPLPALGGPRLDAALLPAPP